MRWLQGSIIKEEAATFKYEIESLFELKKEKIEEIDDIILIMASHSCDIGNTQEPFYEFSIATKITNIDSNFAYSKNPRRLHITIQESCNHTSSTRDIFVEILAHQRIVILKTKLQNMPPSETCVLTDCQIYAQWLSARYCRQALPDEFNIRFEGISRKLRKKGKIYNKYILGFYCIVNPDEEVFNRDYSLSLLVVLSIPCEGKVHQQIEKDMKGIITTNNGINIDRLDILLENKISLHTIKKYKKINFDDISLRADYSVLNF